MYDATRVMGKPEEVMMSTTVGTDVDQVVAVATDYLEAFYSRTAQERSARVERVLHPQLAKRSPRYLQEDGSFRDLTFAIMVQHAAPISVEREPAVKSPYSVKVLDMTPTMASVRTDAFWGVDYIHLAKMKGVWKIVNVLWD
jgi:histidine ammonia-lyase